MKYRQITLNLPTLGGCGDLANITLSSKGRTGGFGPLNRGSNPWGVTPLKTIDVRHLCSYRQAVKSSPFHGEVTGSNPVGSTKLDP